MDERNNWELPPEDAPSPGFPTGLKEFLFGILILVCGWLLCNSVFFGGFNLGFALFSGAVILCSAGYLLLNGCKLTCYSGALLGMSLVIAASFARGDNGLVKFVMFGFLVISTNLGLCLLAGQNRREAKGFCSLLDVPRTIFMLGLGKLPESTRGLARGVRNSGSAGKKGGAVLLGLILALPLVAVVVWLLVRADAAFDGLLRQLPDWNPQELCITLLFGTLLACFLYTRGIGLRHAPKPEPAARVRKGLHPLTVNTVLLAVALVYCVYLVSQLAYFTGGFSGILPEGYTPAQYARRGFFEMAWLCAVNLSVIALAVGLVRRQKAVPLLTRFVCLFIGIVTLFLVVCASAKMFLYIDTYGLTELRVLTEIIMLWLGLSTVVVCLWLFVPKLPYMKVILLLAFLMGAVTAWADVDTVVARYNVTAYQSGKLDTIDVDYLDSLGDGAIPYIARLTDDADPEVAADAREALMYQFFDSGDDFREWNYVNQTAAKYILITEAAEIIDIP